MNSQYGYESSHCSMNYSSNGMNQFSTHHNVSMDQYSQNYDQSSQQEFYTPNHHGVGPDQPGHNGSTKMDSLYSDNGMGHGVVDSTVFHHGNHMDESEMMMDESEYSAYQLHTYTEEDELAEGMVAPRAVHQCNVCNKIFVSFKGLQQHAVIHTDQKPYQCDICGKAFRFKSNLFEHRSVHTGFTPHACPYCGKTCRLKGNLKKHLRTHVTTKEELEAAWRPFASNRRPPADIPDDAVIVRGSGGPYYTQPPKIKKKKLGLGPDARSWIDRIKRGEILPTVDMVEKIRRFEDSVFNSLINTPAALFDCARYVSFETHECPACKAAFLTRQDCASHHTLEHGIKREDVEFCCDKCYRVFPDLEAYQQHESYHIRVQNMIDTGSVSRGEPQILIPTPEDLSLIFGENGTSVPNGPILGMLDTLNPHGMSV